MNLDRGILAALLRPNAMCGSCQATGIEHEGGVEPVDPKRPCHVCKGSGWALKDEKPRPRPQASGDI
jgi:hypothetical protein